MFLIEFMDKLLDILETEPDYHSYLMDSQVIPIEDYLDARPEARERVMAQVKQGRILIGPWYTLPEEFNVSGESLVRNLVIGHKRATEYGGVTKTGYSPFSYGQISQMAQIYRGFGIDTILFYHGIQPEETMSEFTLEAPDGSQVMGSRMGSMARYNFYFGVWRPAVYGMKTLDRQYFWKKGGLPFHFAGGHRYQGHHFLLDVEKSIDDSDLKKALASLKADELEHASTCYLAYMQGMDSTEPDRLEMEVIKKAKDLVEDGDTIFHSSLPEYLDKVKEATKGMDLTVLVGERRTPRALGHKVHLYGDVTSSRGRIKQANTKAEHALQRLAEPFALFANSLGAEYPQQLLDLAWKYLLQSHPHDSIAGSGIDQIEMDVMNRLDQSRTISEGLMRRAMGAIQMRIDNSGVKEDEIPITVFNPSPYSRSEMVEAFIDIPNELEIDFYGVFDAQSNEQVDHQEISRARQMAVVRHLGDATMEMPSDQLAIHFDASDIPALGYKTFLLRRMDDPVASSGSLLTAARKLENDHLIVEVASNGTLDVTDKSSGHVFNGLNEFEDSGEAGHAWRHVPPAYDEVISSVGAPFTVATVDEGPLSASLKIEHRMLIPIKTEEDQSDTVRRIDANGDSAVRSAERREMIVTSIVRLASDSRSVEVTTSFDNTCRDHRLRVCFPTNLSNAKNSFAETPFDVVDRLINHPKESAWSLWPDPTHPMSRFVDVSDGKNGLSVVTDGLREYGVSNTPERRLSITLMRAYQVELTTVAWRWERHPEMELSQCPGKHEYTYRIVPHTGDWTGGAPYQQTERVNLPLEVVQVGPHGGDLPQSMSFLDINPPQLVLSGVKLSESGDAMVVRLFNPTETAIAGTLTSHQPIASASLCNMNEEPESDFTPNGNMLKVDVPKKRVITLVLKS